MKPGCNAHFKKRGAGEPNSFECKIQFDSVPLKVGLSGMLPYGEEKAPVLKNYRGRRGVELLLHGEMVTKTVKLESINSCRPIAVQLYRQKDVFPPTQEVLPLHHTYAFFCRLTQ